MTTINTVDVIDKVVVKLGSLSYTGKVVVEGDVHGDCRG
jgi:uncharacterized protein (DUF342 family)